MSPGVQLMTVQMGREERESDGRSLGEEALDLEALKASLGRGSLTGV